MKTLHIGILSAFLASCSPPPDIDWPGPVQEAQQKVTFQEISCQGCDSNLSVVFSIIYSPDVIGPPASELRSDAILSNGYWTSASPGSIPRQHILGVQQVSSMVCPRIWLDIRDNADLSRLAAAIDDFPATSVKYKTDNGLRDPIGLPMAQVARCDYVINYEGRNNPNLGTPIFAFNGARYHISVGKSCIGQGNGQYVGNSELASGVIAAETSWTHYTAYISTEGPFYERAKWNRVSQSCSNGSAFPPPKTYGPILNCSSPRNPAGSGCLAWQFVPSITW